MRQRLISLIGGAFLLAWAQADAALAGPQRDAVCQGSCGGGCGVCPSVPQRRSYVPAGPSPEEIAHRQRIAASREDNDQGVAAYARGDWAEAVRLQQLALDNDPGDSVIANNLSMARSKLQEQNDSKVASANIRSLIEGYSATVTPMNSTSGLDFDQGSTVPRATNPGAQAAQSLDFGDPMVVDARNVPSGLPKAADDAIASGYADAPPGVSDRVRKGFQAIADHDWKVARAWFQDALNRDPQNPGLKRLSELADFTLMRTQQKSAGKTASASGTLQLPESSDMQFLFSVPKRQLASSGAALQLPKESDLEYLFPGLSASQAKDLSEYTEKYWISQIGTEPQLSHAGRSLPRKSSVPRVKE